MCFYGMSYKVLTIAIEAFKTTLILMVFVVVAWKIKCISLSFEKVFNGEIIVMLNSIPRSSTRIIITVCLILFNTLSFYRMPTFCSFMP